MTLKTKAAQAQKSAKRYRDKFKSNPALKTKCEVFKQKKKIENALYRLKVKEQRANDSKFNDKMKARAKGRQQKT